MTQNKADAVSVDVGNRLRKLREERGISIRELARQCGLSANAISLIERGQTSPSVSTLYRLSEAMEIPITTFFETIDGDSEVVFRKGSERTRVAFSRGVWEGLGGEMFKGRVQPFALTLETGANSGPSAIVHTGHEFVVCLRGQLEYQVEDEIYLLEAGDSLLFQAYLNHRWRNPGPLVTDAIFVLSGFEEAERHLKHITSEE
jgi:transcriptional regulator with XRE-family HTH domain